jgi:hypothetical protein
MAYNETGRRISRSSRSRIEESRPVRADRVTQWSFRMPCKALQSNPSLLGTQFWPEAVTLYKVRADLHPRADLPEERLYALDWSSRR